MNLWQHGRMDYPSLNRPFIAFLFAIVIIFGGITTDVIAQGEGNIGGSTDMMYKYADSISPISVHTKNIRFTPFLAPVYSPETQFMLTGGGLLTFSLNPTKAIIQRSSIPFSLGYSSTGAFQVSVRATVYGKHDRFRLQGDYLRKNMPDNYWGVGYNAALAPTQPDSTTAYDRVWQRIMAKPVFRLSKTWFLGPMFDWTTTLASNPGSVMANDSLFQVQGNSIKTFGKGGTIQFDTRDFMVNAYKGWYLEMNVLNYKKTNDSTFNFWVGEFDLRHYVSVGERRTIAMQYKMRFADKNTTWSELSMIGTPYDLRGYYWGRFRDNSSALILVEYRHMFNPEISSSFSKLWQRCGFVLWSGFGVVSQERFINSAWIPNVGAGFRVEVQKRMNLRVDYGIGTESSAFYFSFNEAF
jgi:hypothetical protein